jgi:hypothetical protein
MSWKKEGTFTTWMFVWDVLWHSTGAFRLRRLLLHPKPFAPFAVRFWYTKITHLVKPTKRITERVPNRPSLVACLSNCQIEDGSTSTKSTIHVGSPINKPSPIEGYYWVYPHYHIWGTSSNRHLNSRSQRRRQSPAGALARSLHSTSQMTKQHAKNGFKGGFLMNKVRILGEGFN